MPNALVDRQKIIEQIQRLRPGRRLISLCDFDRECIPNLPPLGTAKSFQSDLKEALYRVLKESIRKRDKLDLFLYTRGGDLNSVWPIICLLREFDPDFEVLVPFRAHSSGTLLALGAKAIVMTRIAELSPIDPTTGNAFNPRDPSSPSTRLGISVEDVTSYLRFIEESGVETGVKGDDCPIGLDALTREVHPLALGNVHRVLTQIKMLADMVLDCHSFPENRDKEEVIEKLTTGYCSHLHMIGRSEAARILGKSKIKSASTKLERLMDRLLRSYEDQFNLRTPFVLASHMNLDKCEDNVRFIGGVLESTKVSYLFETRGVLSQSPELPKGVQVQLEPGQRIPPIPGLPRKFNFELRAKGWMRNKKPLGVTR